MSERVVAFSDLVSANLLEIGAGRPRSAGLDRFPLPILRVADVAEGRVLPSFQINTPVADSQHMGPKISKPGDVVLTTKGTVGRVAIMPSDGPAFAYSPQLCYFRPIANGPLKARYLYYWFKSEEFWNQADALKGQTDMADFISLSDLYSIRMRLPSIDEQVAAIGIPGALDDKIVANERVIAAAESLMLSLVAAIDVRVPVSEMANQSTASVNPDSFDHVVAHFSLPAFDDGCEPEIAGGGIVKSNKFLLSKPSVLFSKLNPRIPRIWNVVELPTQMAVASTEFVVLVPARVYSSALWAALAQPDISESLCKMVAGTSGSHQRIKASDLLKMRVPDVRTLDESSAALVQQLGQVCHQSRLESNGLVKTRDELLPLLMSGRIRFKDAEACVSEVV